MLVMQECATMSRLHAPLKPATQPKSYERGYRYCSRCAAYYLTDDSRCPCCGGQLRLLPRKRKHIQLKRVIPPPEVLAEAGEVRVRLILRGEAGVEGAGAADHEQL